MYNIDLLEEVHFWKEYLTGGKPRLVIEFGGQTMIIDNELVKPIISWPGIPDDVKMVQDNIHSEDLFTLAELDQISQQDIIDSYEPTEFEDINEPN